MKNRVAISYFFIHGLLEFVCFGYLFTFFANKSLPWLIALSYDFIAFMPQGIIGDLHHRLRKLPLGSIGFVEGFLKFNCIAFAAFQCPGSSSA